jgi:hypothetical protein
MNEKVLFIANKDSVTLTDGKGGTLQVVSDVPEFKEVVRIIESGEIENMSFDQVKEAVSVAKKLEFEGNGVKFTFDEETKDLTVQIAGEKTNFPMAYSFKKRIVGNLRKAEEFGVKFQMGIYANFIKKLSENPSYTVCEQLFGFLEANDVPITSDGNFRCYKKIDYDYYDLHSHTMLNSIGAVVKMNRNEVEDNPDVTCSRGLHACSKDYLQHYGSSDSKTNRVVIVEIDPRNVVSVPRDYNNAKMRVCEYTVVDEMTDFDASLAPYVFGKHENGWIAKTLEALKAFYQKFWGLKSDEKFTWESIDREDFLTEAIAERFDKDFAAEFHLSLEKIDAYELALSPLEALGLLSMNDENALTSEEE